MNKNIIITLKKELRSIFRDKKTITRMLLFPIIIPVMIVFYGFLYDNMESTESTYLVGMNYEVTEAEKTILEDLNIDYKVYKDLDELESAYKNNEIEAYIDYKEKNYTIYTNTGETSGMFLVEYLTIYLDSYSQTLTNEYLINQGINIEEAYNHFTYDYKELSETNYLFQIIINVCVMYIILAIGMAATNMAISSSAQEKENGTLETILTFPIKRTELILGKYFASSIISFISSLIALILLIVSMLFAQKQFVSFQDFNMVVSPTSVLGSLAVIICASLFVSGIAFLLTGRAKSFKEAQSSSSMINMIMLIPMFISLAEVEIT